MQGQERSLLALILVGWRTGADWDGTVTATNARIQSSCKSVTLSLVQTGFLLDKLNLVPVIASSSTLSSVVRRSEEDQRMAGHDGCDGHAGVMAWIARRRRKGRLEKNGSPGTSNLKSTNLYRPAKEEFKQV